MSGPLWSNRFLRIRWIHIQMSPTATWLLNIIWHLSILGEDFRTSMPRDLNFPALVAFCKRLVLKDETSNTETFTTWIAYIPWIFGYFMNIHGPVVVWKRIMSHMCLLLEIGRHTRSCEMQRRATVSGIATESLYCSHEVSPEPCVPGKCPNTHEPISRPQSNKESQPPFLSRIPSFRLAPSPWNESETWNKYRSTIWRNHFHHFRFRSHPRRLSTFRKVWISTGNCL